MLEVLIAMAIFAMGAIVLIASYVNVLNSYHSASQGLQGDQELAFCRSQLMTITDVNVAGTGQTYDTPTTPDAAPVHIQWSADIEPTAMTDVFTVTLTVLETPAGKDPTTVVDVFTLLRPTWSQGADRTTLQQATTSAILTYQAKQAK